MKLACVRRLVYHLFIYSPLVHPLHTFQPRREEKKTEIYWSFIIFYANPRLALSRIKERVEHREVLPHNPCNMFFSDEQINESARHIVMYVAGFTIFIVPQSSRLVP